MTTMKTQLDNNTKICGLSEAIGYTTMDLKEITNLASKASHQLANVDDNGSIEDLAVAAVNIWNCAENLERPNGPNHRTISDERDAGWDGTAYMPSTPDDVARTEAAAKSAARGLAVLCRLMAERFDGVGQT